MHYREQFPPHPFFPRFATPEEWQEYMRTDLVEYTRIMDRNQAIFYEDYGRHQAQVQAQQAEEARIAAEVAATTFDWQDFGL
ncbi:hypothetical protein A2U01_0083002, partial [Trifolium medium]|nr:hypothetical protein [Trifolium medium]